MHPILSCIYADVKGNYQLVHVIVNHSTPNDLQRCRAISPLKIKILSKVCVQSQQMQQLFIQFINYVW
jgi:hypothetical protein